MMASVLANPALIVNRATENTDKRGAKFMDTMLQCVVENDTST